MLALWTAEGKEVPGLEEWRDLRNSRLSFYALLGMLQGRPCVCLCLPNTMLVVHILPVCLPPILWPVCLSCFCLCVLLTYVCVCVCQGVSVCCVALAMNRGSVRASSRLHDNLLTSKLSLPLSFFKTTPTSWVLRNFSQVRVTNTLPLDESLVERIMYVLFLNIE